MPAESARWPRPETIPYPNVWKRFKGRKEINGVIPSFWIQDVPEDEFQNVVNCMVERFCTEEPLTKYSGMLKDPKSVEDMRNLWIYMLHNRVGLACYKENSDPRGKPIFAGVNCMHIKKKHEPEYKFSGTTVLQIFGTLVAAANKTDLYEFFGTDAFLSSLGLYVLPEFRGQGIGLEMLLARQEMCKALKVKAAITLFTSTVSQVLAEKAGYNVLNEISYADLRDVYKFDYPGAEEKHKSVKYMYVLYK
ncbi:hypothetical protein PPYR_08314 [Photinus pyralis]|uniref:N-acetyltransferase domain-containing protein n=2 Tax=Photinus pyralis TaxID=7054 RepID=A0A5N4AIY9_PHOPY|nr:hypothetical protein PPYR_08314 [Photinus pyralis]